MISYYKYRSELFVTGCCTLGTLAMGSLMGFSSPTLDVLTDEGLLEGTQQRSWFVSLGTLCALFGTIFAGFIVDKYGRKLTIVVGAALATIGFFPIAAANGCFLLLLGRVISGLGGGMLVLVCPMYVAEISSAEVRGFEGAFLMAGLPIGTLLTFTSALFLSWRWLAIVCLVPSALMTCIAVFLPESPRWLMSKGYESDAKRVLHLLRSSEEDIGQELQHMQQTSQTPQTAWRELVSPHMRKRFAICIMMALAQAFSGIMAILGFTVNIFQSVNYNGNVFIPPVYIALGKAIAAISFSFFLDKVGRRPSFIVVGIVLTACCALFGTYYYCLEDRDLDWIAVTCLVVYTFAFNCAWNSVPWVFTTEVFPQELRGRASTVFVISSCLANFIVTFTFLPAQRLLTPAGLFWAYGGACLISSVAAMVFLPETKGKTLEQIQEMFAGNNTTAKIDSGGENAEIEINTIS